MILFFVEETLCLMDFNDFGFLIFSDPLNLTRYLTVDFQKKYQNYH